MNQITGKVIAILEPQSGDSRNNPGTRWMRQEFVIETQDMYPRKVCFNIWGEDRIRQADIHMDDMITIDFEISSREYNGRWYTNIEARNVQKNIEPQMGGAPAAGTSMPGAQNKFGGEPVDSSEDLPF